MVELASSVMSHFPHVIKFPNHTLHVVVQSTITSLCLFPVGVKCPVVLHPARLSCATVGSRQCSKCSNGPLSLSPACASMSWIVHSLQIENLSFETSMFFAVSLKLLEYTHTAQPYRVTELFIAKKFHNHLGFGGGGD